MVVIQNIEGLPAFVGGCSEANLPHSHSVTQNFLDISFHSLRTAGIFCPKRLMKGTKACSATLVTPEGYHVTDLLASSFRALRRNANHSKLGTHQNLGVFSLFDRKYESVKDKNINYDI